MSGRFFNLITAPSNPVRHNTINRDSPQGKLANAEYPCLKDRKESKILPGLFSHNLQQWIPHLA